MQLCVRSIIIVTHFRIFVNCFYYIFCIAFIFWLDSQICFLIFVFFHHFVMIFVYRNNEKFAHSYKPFTGSYRHVLQKGIILHSLLSKRCMHCFCKEQKHSANKKGDWLITTHLSNESFSFS